MQKSYVGQPALQKTYNKKVYQTSPGKAIGGEREPFPSGLCNYTIAVFFASATVFITDRMMGTASTSVSTSATACTAAMP